MLPLVPEIEGWCRLRELPLDRLMVWAGSETLAENYIAELVAQASSNRQWWTYPSQFRQVRSSTPCKLLERLSVDLSDGS